MLKIFKHYVKLDHLLPVASFKLDCCSAESIRKTPSDTCSTGSRPNQAEAVQYHCAAHKNWRGVAGKRSAFLCFLYRVQGLPNVKDPG